MQRQPISHFEMLLDPLVAGTISSSHLVCSLLMLVLTVLRVRNAYAEAAHWNCRSATIYEIMVATSRTDLGFGGCNRIAKPDLSLCRLSESSDKGPSRLRADKSSLSLPHDGASSGRFGRTLHQCICCALLQPVRSRVCPAQE